jgi:MFS family permease
VLLGGVLTSGFGWQWVLLVNFPAGLVAASLAPLVIPESRSRVERRVFDVAGAVSVTGGLVVLVYALLNANSAGWTSLSTLGMLALAVVLLVAFVVIERRSPAPLVPFRIFRVGTVAGTNVVGLLLGAALFSMFFFVSLYMQKVLGYGALTAGLAYLPLAVTIAMAAGAAYELVTRFGTKPVLIAGLIFIAGGLAWFSQVSVNGSYMRDILVGSLIAPSVSASPSCPSRSPL